MNFNIKVVFLFLITFNCISQEIIWEKSLGGRNSEYLLDMISTLDNGFLLAGATQSSKSGDLHLERKSNYDAWLWKMKSNGSKEWDMRISGIGDNYLNSVNHTKKDGGFILGLTSSSGKDHFKTHTIDGKSHAWVIKLNAARGVLWQRVFGGIETEELVKIKNTNNGGHLVLINSNSIESETKQVPYYGGQDIWLILLDGEGNVQWEKSFGGEYDDVAIDIAETKEGDFVLGGYSNSSSSGNNTTVSFGNNDYWIIKLDSTGEIKWQKNYGGSGNDQLKQIVLLNDSSYQLLGSSDSTNDGNKLLALGSDIDYWFINIDDQGEIEAQWAYGYGNQNVMSNALINSKKDIFLGGTVGIGSSKEKEIKYIGTLFDSIGQVRWERSFGQSGENVLSKFIMSRDGAFVLAGTSDGRPNREKSQYKGLNDFWVIKIKPDLPTEEGFYENSEEEILQEKFKIEAIPNPVTSFTNIIIPVDYSSGVLKLFDASGRLLHQHSIRYQIEPLDMGGYPYGAYIVNIKTDTIEGSVQILKK